LSRAACTIISPNYLAFARTLCSSYLRQHPGDRFFVLLVADLKDATRFEGDRFAPVLLQEIGLQDLRGAAMKYDILELNTNVKPTFLKFLLKRFQLECVVYLDPDIFVYAPLQPVFDAVEKGASAVLTPHITTPVFDGRSPSEQDLLYNGTYNLGFFAAAHTPEGLRVLEWWEERCLEVGFSEGRTGLFVDQKWMNLAPGLFEGVVILRDAGCNMAYWNLHERTLLTTGGVYEVESRGGQSVPLRFFHFSGVVISDPELLSRNTNRYTLAARPDLQRLFADYRNEVSVNGRPQAEALPYGFDRFSDGTAVTRLARRMYAEHKERFECVGKANDPFDERGPFARFAREQGLIAGPVVAGKSTWREFDPQDRRVYAVHLILRIALRVLGPNRYELLMRYLSHITVLRHQSVFLRDPKWIEQEHGQEAEAAQDRAP
jgi:hypothetical protein